jgi:hypothetical protein
LPPSFKYSSQDEYIYKTEKNVSTECFKIYDHNYFVPRYLATFLARVVPAKPVKLLKGGASMGLDYVLLDEHVALKQELETMREENTALRYVLVSLVGDNQRLKRELEEAEDIISTSQED